MMPKWVAEEQYIAGIKEQCYVIKLKQSLTVAIEALNNIQKVARIEYAHSFSKSALAKIEAMGG